MDNSIAERVEYKLQELEARRVKFESELEKVKEDLKLLIDGIFDELAREINPIIEETDSVVEGHLRDFRKLVGRRNELKILQERLAPVLDILGDTS